MAWPSRHYVTWVERRRYVSYSISPPRFRHPLILLILRQRAGSMATRIASFLTRFSGQAIQSVWKIIILQGVILALSRMGIYRSLLHRSLCHASVLTSSVSY